MGTTSVEAATDRLTDSPADARERTRDFLDALARPLARGAADTVVLVVSELVTNALRHGGGTYKLDLTAHPGGIEVAVHDPSPPLMPRQRVPDLIGGTGGFGCHMINDLALTTSATRRASGGKTVTALLPRT
ncbi:ATP-binding protein [Streptomyces sp. NPDC101733]|uniref:ATP-binding protein n=1 Tax=unclassified Streptomyces TaxID=2593676 RepID=UPI00381695EE